VEAKALNRVQPRQLRRQSLPPVPNRTTTKFRSDHVLIGGLALT